MAASIQSPATLAGSASEPRPLSIRRQAIALVLLLIAAGNHVATAPNARACSCAQLPEDSALDIQIFEADLAFVASFTSSTGGDGGGTQLIEFEVHQVLAGDVPATLTATTPGATSCGDSIWADPNARPRGRALVTASARGRDISLPIRACVRRPTLDDLTEKLEQQLPPPTASGPATAIVPMRDLWADLAAVNREGEVLAYHAGSTTYAVAVCPDAKHILVLRPTSVDVLDVATMGTVHSIEAPDAVPLRNLVCLTAGPSSLSFAAPAGGVKYPTAASVTTVSDVGVSALQQPIETATVLVVPGTQEVVWFPLDPAAATHRSSLSNPSGDGQEGPVIPGVVAAALSTDEQVIGALVSDDEPLTYSSAPSRVEFYRTMDLSLITSMDLIEPDSDHSFLAQDPYFAPDGTLVALAEADSGGGDLWILDPATEASAAVEIELLGYSRPRLAYADGRILRSSEDGLITQTRQLLVADLVLPPPGTHAVISDLSWRTTIDDIGISSGGMPTFLLAPIDVEPFVPPAPTLRLPDEGRRGPVSPPPTPTPPQREGVPAPPDPVSISELALGESPLTEDTALPPLPEAGEPRSDSPWIPVAVVLGCAALLTAAFLRLRRG